MKAWSQKTVDKAMRRLPIGLIDSPWESFVSGLGLLGGISILFSEARPMSLEKNLPRVVVFAWAVMLLLGCAMVFYGLMRTRELPERVGLQLLCVASLVYGIVAIYALGFRGITVIFPYLGFAGASYIRVWQLKKGYGMRVVPLGGNGAAE